MIIYKATNNVNGKVYIGQTVNSLQQRKRGHVGDSKRHNYRFGNALNKYGEENFKWEVICICSNIDSLNEQEQYYIIYYDSMNKDIGYNLTSGGENYIRSEETLKKLSGENHWNYGKKVLKESKEKIRKSCIGIKPSKITRVKMSKAQSGENNPNYGKKASEKSKLKMSESHRKENLSKETIEKMSKAQSGKNNSMYGKKGKNNPNYGRKASKETRQKQSENHADVNGQNHPMWGKHQSEETITKRSGENHWNYGKHHSEVTRQKQRIARLKYLERKKGTSVNAIFS